MAGERVDEIAGQMRAIGRGQRRALLAPEVIVKHQFGVVLGQDQVDAGPFEVRVEKQMRVGNDDRVCWNLGRAVNRYGRTRRLMPTGAIGGKRGVKFASVIQWATAIG